MTARDKRLATMIVMLSVAFLAFWLATQVEPDPTQELADIMDAPLVESDWVEPDPPCPRPGACEIVDLTGESE